MNTPPRELTAAEIGRLDIVEIIMAAPLDQAIAMAVGRASTCWTDVDGTFGMTGVFDDATATRIVDAILTRITCELAAEAANARGEDRARALIPTVPPPAATTERGQCPELLRLEGAARPSRCLHLEGHDGDEHQNGNLRWRRDPATGEVAAWWDTQVYETVSLGELLRAENVHMTLPHLPAGAAAPLESEPDTTARITFKGDPARQIERPEKR